MKKLFLSIIALTVSAIVITLFCVNSSAKSDKFIGEWKRTDKTGNNLVIKKQDDAILIFSGKHVIAAEYDKNKNILKAYLSSSSIISYIEKTDHILINNGDGGDYERIR
jgi:hypothetical protein